MIVKKLNFDVCPYQISFLLDNFLRRLFQDPKQIVGEYIKKDDTVIDLGCGPGYFTIDMAEMAGEGGKVLAVDIQEKMLETVRRKAVKSGFENRIILHKTYPGKTELDSSIKADFILAYYMIHETGNYTEFLKEIKRHLKEEGRFLIVEPSIHVSRKKYEKLAFDVEGIGFKIIDRPEGRGGRSLLLGV